MGVSDAQLLDRFATRRDEAAFAALVDGYGAMVLAVCRDVLLSLKADSCSAQVRLPPKSHSARTRDRRACGSPGGRSSERKANKSDSSFRSRIVSIPSGIIDSLLVRVYFTSLRATISFPPPGIASTMRRSLSSVTSPVRLRPSSVTTVVVW